MGVVAIKKTSSNSDMRYSQEQELVRKWSRTQNVTIKSFLDAVRFENRGDFEIVNIIVNDVLKNYPRVYNYYLNEYNLDEFISMMNKTKEDEKNPVENWRKSFEEIMLNYIMLV